MIVFMCSIAVLLALGLGVCIGLLYKGIQAKPLNPLPIKQELPPEAERKIKILQAEISNFMTYDGSEQPDIELKL